MNIKYYKEGEAPTQVKLLHEWMTLEHLRPETPGSAGYDLRYAHEVPLFLKPGDWHTVGTGIALHLRDPNIAAKILPRSGAGTRGLVLANSVGLIDSDYQKEIKVVLLNRTTDVAFTIQPMQRIAQMIFINVIHPQFDVVERFDSDTGREGFGSTGN